MMALVGLVCFGVFAFAVVRVALSNLLILSLMLAAVLVGGYGGWLMFSGKGGRFRRGAVMATLAVVGVVIGLLLFLGQPDNLRYLLAAIVSGAVYVGVFALMRRLYWQHLREKHLGEQAEFKKPWLIINPKSGDGRAVKAGLAQAARQQGIRVVTMKKGDDMQKLARQAIMKGADVLGISGGDGSIGAVAKVAFEHDLPLVVLPGGTRCHFARDLGMDPRYLVDALAGFHGIERLVDVGDINGRIFLNNVSIGAYADIVDHDEYRENKVAVTRCVLREILSGKKPSYPMRFQTPNGPVTEAVQVLIGVNRYTSMKLLELGHRSQMDGGVLQVNAVLKLTDAFIGRLVRSASFDRIKGKISVDDFMQFETRKLRIKNKDQQMVVGVDGERETYRSPLVITCRPKALRLYVPAEGLRPRPKSMFSRETLAHLVKIAKDGAV